MPHIKKQVLAPGVYWAESQDDKGNPVVTPCEFTRANLEYFCEAGQARLAAGVHVPIPLEHQFGIENKSKAELDAFSASHNTGFVAGWEMADDGTLWADLDVAWLPDAKDDAEIERRLKGAIRFVSPLISPKHQDGAGREWTDVITHVALTPQPVFLGQQPFGSDGAALRLSRSPGRPLALSLSCLWHTSAEYATAVPWDDIDWPLAFAAERAPKGGISIAGKFYPGGRFIPATEMEKATPEEKAKVEGNKAEVRSKREAGGPIDSAELRKKLVEAAKKLGGFGGEVKLHAEYARRSYASLKDHHGDLLLHRVQELVAKDLAALERGETHAANGQRITARLAVAAYWMKRYEQDQAAGDGAVDAGGVDGAGDVGGIKQEIVTARPEHTQRADPGVVSEGLRKHLNDIQVQGAALAITALDKAGGFLLADGAGTGKTRQLLAVAQTYAQRGKKVLYCSKNDAIRPDWKAGTPSGSLADDSAAMGVPLVLTDGKQPLQAGQVAVTTYDRLDKLKGQIDADTIVLYDEAHALKNTESARSATGREVSAKAGGVLYGSATPADQAIDTAYLFRTQVFEGKTDKEIAQHFNADKHGAAEVFRRTDEMFQQLTAKGLMAKRELSLDGVDFHLQHVELPPEAHEALAKAGAAVGSKNKAQALMRQRALQEIHKVPATIDHVHAELAAGRQVVVFCTRVNPEEGESGTVGTPQMLREALAKAGVTDIAELHGGEGSSPTAAADFQSGKARVIITTPQSGGTGINLHDKAGDRPRTQIQMTPNFSGIDEAQMAGRTWRLGTKSRAKIVRLFADTPVDRWNMDLMAGKLRSMNAIVAGQTARLQPGELPTATAKPDVMAAAAQKTKEPAEPQSVADEVNAIAAAAPATPTSPKTRGARFGDKVFLHHVYDEYAKKHPGATRQQFDAALMEAHNQGLVELSRADLTEAMHPEDVRASETKHPTGAAEFHFVHPKRRATKLSRPVPARAAARITRPPSRPQPGLTKPVHLSKGGPAVADKKNGDDPLFTDDELDGAGEGTAEEEEEKGAEDLDDRATIDKAAECLSGLNLMVEPCDDPMEFIRHICTAAETSKAHTAEQEGEVPAATPTPEEPNYQALSRQMRKQDGAVKVLQKQNARLATDLADRLATDLLGDIDALVAGEFLDADTAKEWKSSVGAKKLSLAQGGSELATIKSTVAAMKKQMERKAVTDPLLQERLALSRGVTNGAVSVPRPDNQWGKDDEATMKTGKEVAGVLLKAAGYAPRTATK